MTSKMNAKKNAGAAPWASVPMPETDSFAWRVAMPASIVQNAGDQDGPQASASAGDDVLTGTEGDDQINGLGGADVLNGLGGRDLLTGDTGGDTLNGGEGDDFLFAAVNPYPFTNPTFPGSGAPPPTLDTGTETDTLSGGGGNDALWAGYGDHVDGGAGTDILYISFKGATSGVQADFRLTFAGGTLIVGGGAITGIESMGWIEGSDFDDFIASRGSNSAFAPIYGLGGNDHIIAQIGDGHLYGGVGNDILDANLNMYSQFLSGGEGDDQLIGHYGNAAERFEGGDGNDSIRCAGFTDTAFGGAGIDIIDGGNGADTLLGEDGNDTLYGAGDADTIDGGGGDDVIHGDFSLISSANGLFPPSNSDLLNGGDGNDVIDGNQGDDTINGGTGTDTMRGGAGNDTMFVDNGGDVIVELTGEGYDVVAASLSWTLTAGAYVELMTTGWIEGTALINLSGNELDQQIWGNGAANIISGGDGDDTLFGFGGADTLVGGNGKDVFFGGAGANDSLRGGLGDDTYFADDAGDAIVEAAGEGQDVAASSVDYVLGAGVSVELMTTGFIGGIFTLALTGNELGNEIWGNDGVNQLNGGGGNVTDALFGFGGDDRLDGGGGLDLLVGGTGQDSFVFANTLSSAEADIVADFSSADDTILIDDAVFTGVVLGALNPNAFVIGTAALDADDRIIYDAASGKLYFDADGNGAGAAIQFATLSGTPALTASDFAVF